MGRVRESGHGCSAVEGTACGGFCRAQAAGHQALVVERTARGLLPRASIGTSGTPLLVRSARGAFCRARALGRRGGRPLPSICPCRGRRPGRKKTPKATGGQPWVWVSCRGLAKSKRRNYSSFGFSEPSSDCSICFCRASIRRSKRNRRARTSPRSRSRFL